jgi:hypothetical protein
MAPLPDAAVSSTNLLKSYVFAPSTHITRSLISSSNLIARSDDSTSQSSTLQTRDSSYNPGSGTTPPSNIPNNAVFALFGLIGAGFVITGIWFFFWAKNGGFYFKEGDWEDYKSTVLRRKGPNGTTLSGATPSTNLGGGSVVGRKQRLARYKDAETESSIGTQSEMSEIKAGRGGRTKREKNKHKSRRRPKPVDEESVVSGMMEDDLPPEEVVRAYRHEKPARVGGINKVPDSSTFDGSTHDSHSDLLSNRECTPTNTPTKKVRNDTYTGGSGSVSIRKVESTSGGHSGFWSSSSKKKTEEHEKEDHIKAEARKLQEKGRAAVSSASGGGSSRRDFSYTIGDDTATIISGLTADEERRERRKNRTSKIPGSYTESSVGSEIGSDVSGTKAYHHPIPGLSEYAEERRRQRERGEGYRRGE